MTMSKKIISVILVITLMATTFCLSGLSASASTSTSAKTQAAKAIDEKYDATGVKLGAIYSPTSTTFRVWSPTASKVVLNLYATGSDQEEGAEKLGTHDLYQIAEPIGEESGLTGIWETTVAGDLDGVYYTYSITTTNTTGTLASTTYETQDIYSQAVGVNGNRSMVVDLDDTDPEGWENDTYVLLDENTDASIWEIHVKDFSYNPNSGISEKNRGKYLAFTEEGTTLNGEGVVSTGIDYLKELGITSVHINPFYDYASVDEAGSDTQFNWGYDPKNYNVPEGSYSSDPYNGKVRIEECKEMIMALHNAGIQVIMDVVYNHTYDTNSSFQRTVPDYYYRFQNNGSLSNGSGCGNDTASENAMFRKFMVESVRYWADEYHIDGFRFDLMGLHDVDTLNAIRASLDEIDPRLIMYGEAWDLTTYTQPNTTLATQRNFNKLDTRIAAFNDQIRDGLKGSVFDATGKGFIQGTRTDASDVAYGVRANTAGGAWTAQAPSQCVTYASCHDNATLYDRLVYSVKGENADFTKRYDDLIEMNKLSSAIVMTSQGINFMLAGEEMGRTKLGDENSYSSAATLNMLDWEQLVSNADLVSYYKGLLKIRKAFSPFTDSTNNSKDNYTFTNSLTTTTYVVSYTLSNDTPGEWSKVAVFYNCASSEKSVTLADKSVTEWVIIANDKEAGLTSLGEVEGSTFTIPASSALIAVEKSSFEEANLSDNLGKVTVTAKIGTTGEVLSTRVVKGTVGTKYAVSEDASVDIKYVVSGIEGEETGVFTEEPQEVAYTYTDYVPESMLNADINGDGDVNIKDATEIQRALANFIPFTDEQRALADVDYDGDVNISDVTALQMYLAAYSVAVGTVEVNYIDNETGEKIAASEVLRGRVGTDYSTAPKSILAYTYDEENAPTNAEGKFAYRKDKVVNYYYNYSGQRQTLHIRFAEGVEEVALNAWAWQMNVPDIGEVNLCKNGSWPGDAVSSAKDDAGWMTYQIDSPGAGQFCFILSKGGSPQSNDYKGYTQNELWVIVNNMADKTNFMDVYDVDPIENPDATPLPVIN